MKDEIEPTEASRQYAVAYAAQYSERDLPLALRHYQQLLASHADSQEAGYARSQVRNIVNTVVPKQELQDVQMNLLLAHFQRDGRLDATKTPLAPLVHG